MIPSRKGTLMPDNPPEPGEQIPQAGGVPPGPPASGPQPSTSSGGKTDIVSLIIGIGFWVIIIGFVIQRWYFSENSDLMLNVRTSPLAASGIVTYQGGPVSGRVQIAIEDTSGHYLASKVVDVKDGAFNADLPEAQVPDGTPLRVTASFKGQAPRHWWEWFGDQEALQGTATRYLNSTAPPSMWWGAGVGVVLLLLTFLFTGPLSPWKARLLFGVSYVLTFSACLIPILLSVSVSRSSYLRSLMQESSVGILEATTATLTDPQWLVNLGGAVVFQPATVAPGPATPNPAPTQPVADKAGATAPTPGPQGNAGNTPPGAAATQPAPIPAGAQPTEPAKQADQKKSEPPPQDKAAASDAKTPQYPVLKGGLAIPLYVMILAMLGAAINMTRKVPEIQAESDAPEEPTPQGALRAFAFWLRPDSRSVESRQTEIKRRLIETYLYFLSAPFLVIAVYYLLQVVATSVTQPTLVVVAFGTGLMSNTAVEAIITFADGILENVKKNSSSGSGGARGSSTSSTTSLSALRSTPAASAPAAPSAPVAPPSSPKQP
jgi:hypothetical protein